MPRPFVISPRSAQTMRRGIHLVKPAAAAQSAETPERENLYAEPDVRESRLLALAILAMTVPLTWFLHEVLHHFHF